MHLTLPILLSLLSTTALTLPTTTTNTTQDPTTTLSKRKDAWIGSYANGDCSGQPVSRITAVNNDECHQWSPASGTKSIGINYGSTLGRIDEVTFYTDTNCKDVVGNAAYLTQVGDGTSCTGANDGAMSFDINWSARP